MFTEPVFEVLANPVANEDLAWPTITIDKPEDPPKGNAQHVRAPVEQDVWDYLVEHIHEFEVAKSITDFVEANPKALSDRSTPVDLLGLHLLAKVSQKRSAVRFAKEQAAQVQASQAVIKAREQSRHLKSRVKRTTQQLLAMVGVVRDNPHLAVIATFAAFAVYSWTH